MSHGRALSSSTSSGQGRTWPWVALILLWAVAFNLVHLYPEVAIHTPRLNDGVLHLLTAERAAATLGAGQDPTDFWLGSVTFGYPLVHHYQHLPYVALALAHRLTGWPVATLFDWSGYLLLCLFPLSVYGAMRRVGFGPLPAVLAGLAAPLLSTDGLYGFDFGSYVWRGFGLYTQLWGMVLLPPAVAEGYVTLRTGRGYLRSTLWLSATLLAHLVSGYIAGLSLAALILLPVLGRVASPPDGEPAARAGVLRRVGRLLVLGAGVALATAYFWVPYVLDGAYMNRSVWEKAVKMDSYGAPWVLNALLHGELFDFGRLPALTLAAALGVVVCARRWRDERYRLPVVLGAAWLLLFFGRPTWGVLLNVLPLSADMQFHRLILGVHLAGLGLIGLGLALPWEWAVSRPRWQVAWLAAAGALTVLLLYPAYAERREYLDWNARWMAESQAATDAETRDVEGLLGALRALPPGRVYAGLAATWGRDYKIGYVPVYALLNSAGLDVVGFLYHALSLNADVEVLFDERRAEQYDLFDVRYVVAPADHPLPDFARLVGTFGRHRLYRVATSGYFEFVRSDLAFTGGKADFYPAAAAWLGSAMPAAMEHPTLLLERAERGGPPRLSAAAPLAGAADTFAGWTCSATLCGAVPAGQVLSETVESQAYAASVTVPQTATLMLKATFHPGLHAIVDGAPVATTMLMPSYVGVTLPPGAHQVRVEYRPGPLRRILMGVGLLALVVLGVVGGRLSKASSGAVLPKFRFLAPHAAHLAAVAGMALLAGLPLFQLKEMSGHDALAYLPRTVEFWQGLQAGQWLPRWAPDLSGGYGQPLFNFVPPLFYAPTAAFHVLGAGFVAAQDMAMFALLLLAGGAMYGLAADIFGQRGGLIAAAAYVWSPWLLANLYVRQALADFTALPFIPLAWWGLYRFARDGRPRFLFVGVAGLAGIMLASNTLALITIPVAGLLVAGLAWAERRGGVRAATEVIGRGLWCLGLSLGLSAFFWWPALAERDGVHLERVLDGYLSFANHFVYLHQLVYSPWGYGYSWPGPQDGMSFMVGPAQLLAVAAAAVWLWRSRGAADGEGAGEDCRIAAKGAAVAAPGGVRLWLWFGLGAFGLAAFFSSVESAFLWDRLPLLQYLEFPWRFLSLAAPAAALLCGAAVLHLPRGRPRLARAMTAALLVALVLFGVFIAHPERFLDVKEADYTPQEIARRWLSVTTKEEYEPVWVRERPRAPRSEPLTLLSGAGTVLSTREQRTGSMFQARVTETARYRINTFYFPGWTLSVDGAERPVEYGNPQGLMEFTLEPGEHAIRVWFGDTPVRRAAAWLSLAALLALLLTPAALWLRRRAQKDGSSPPRHEGNT